MRTDIASPNNKNGMPPDRLYKQLESYFFKINEEGKEVPVWDDYVADCLRRTWKFLSEEEKKKRSRKVTFQTKENV